MKTFAERVAVVTGAASGIGRALVVQLRAQGATVVAADVDEAGLADLAQQTGAQPHKVDVSDREAMAAFAAKVGKEHGRVHLLVNNAGLTVIGSFPEQSLEDWDRVMGVNFFGVLHGCRFFLPWLRAADQARIVNISSVFGIAGIPGQTSYCASKYAVRGLSEALWEELRGTHIGLTVVHPGGVATNIVESASSTAGAESDARTKRRFARAGIPPEDAAAAILGAVRKGKPRLLVTREAPVIDWARRLFPVRGNRWVADLVVKALGQQELRKAQVQAFLDGSAGD